MNTEPSETIWSAARWGEAIESVVALAGRSPASLALELVVLEQADDAKKLDYIRAFVDDAGHCRPTDRLVLAWWIGLTEYEPGQLAVSARLSTPPVPLTARALSNTRESFASSSRLDRVLWECLLLHCCAGGHASPLPEPIMAQLTSTTGPLCPEVRADGIEVWSEAELATLHALWWLTTALTPDPLEQTVLKARAYDHARWLMDEIQPDNATNRPWALGVFAAMACADDFDAAGDAQLYAQTLLHNCQVQLGRPDRFSTVLLFDAISLLGIYGADPG